MMDEFNITTMLTSWRDYCYSRTEQADDLGNTRVAECSGCELYSICKSSIPPFVWDEEDINRISDKISTVMSKDHSKPKGYWQRNIKTSSAHFTCTNCGNITFDSSLSECPKCGAIMGGIWTDVN